MNEDLNQTFKDYIEAFKLLGINDKKIQIVNSLKEMNALIDALAERENKRLSYLKSKEITEFKNGMESEDDFLEALLVYIENSKELLSQYLIDKI